MNLTDREVANLIRLQEEIDREANGKCRGFMIKNRTRQIRLLLHKATRREKELEAKRKTQGVQLSLFTDDYGI